MRETGLLTQDEIAQVFGISRQTVVRWREHGLLRGRVYNSRRDYLYEPVGEHRTIKNNGLKLSDRHRYNEIACDSNKEVQHEA